MGRVWASGQDRPVKPVDRARAPKPPRDMVEVFTLGLRALDFAILVAPVFAPIFLLSAAAALDQDSWE